MLKECLGPSAISRFEQDILKQNGVRWAIIFIGVNDIGGVKSAEAEISTSDELIEAYKQMIEAAHAKNIKVYGATLMPFKGNQYYNQHSEVCRRKVNDWIRNSGQFYAIIDFDRTMQSPQDIEKLESSYQNDCLHPDAVGYKKMGESIYLRFLNNSFREK